MNTLWFLLPGILYLGIITSYTDIRYGKIKNRDVLIGIFYALAVYLSLFVYFFVASGVNYMYFLELITNAVFALSVAFGLWYYKVWSAGDGKLFFAFALLIPLEIYQYGRYNWVPSITFLFNMFIISFLIMIFIIFKKAKIKNYNTALKSFMIIFLEPKNLFRLLVSLFAVFWLAEILLVFFGLEGYVLIRYIIAILIMVVISVFSQNLKIKIMKIDLGVLVMASIVILRFMIDESIYSASFWLNYAGLVLIWGVLVNIFRGGASVLGKDVFSDIVRVNSLKPGMVLSDILSKTKKLSEKEINNIKKNGWRYFKKGKFFYVIGANKFGKDYLDVEPEGLTKSQIKKISNLGIEKVRIASTIYFAPLILLGVIATILVNGNILILVSNLF